MQRIPVTHAGSLIRPQELLAFLSAVDHGRASTDSVEYQAALARAVAYAVRRQVETGVDVIDDGEMGKSTWITYLYERTSGLEARPLVGNFSSILPASRDRQNFPGAYRELDMLEHDATIRIRAEAGGQEPQAREEGTRAPSGAVTWVCTGPMIYDRTAIDRDLVNFKVALEGTGKDISETFMPVVAPASAYWLANEHYRTDEEFVYALADVLHEEYQAIIESGAFLQVDDAVLMHEADTMAVARPVLGGLPRLGAAAGGGAQPRAARAAGGPHQVPRLLRELARAACLRPAAARLDRPGPRGEREVLPDGAGQPAA